MAPFYLIFLPSKAAIFLSILFKITPFLRCKLMGHLGFLLALCFVIEFYKRVFLAFLGFFIMDCASSLNLLIEKYDFGFGIMDCASSLNLLIEKYDFGFLIFGGFCRVFNVLVLFCVFILGFKLMKFKGKSIEVKINNGLLKSFECGSRKKVWEQKIVENNEIFDENGNEDEVFEVMSLRKMVKSERRKANAAQIELEKERMAASSSVDEAMAMILRLQSEKSGLQILVNQLERVTEEKQCHDQDVIQSLQWIVMKHESERSLLEEQLRLCREKLRVFLKGEEWDQFDCVCPTPSVSHSSFGNFDNDVMIKGFDLDSMDI